MSARRWFTDDQVGSFDNLTKEDVVILNRAVRHLFPPNQTPPSTHFLMNFRSIYKKGMSALDLIDAFESGCE